MTREEQDAEDRKRIEAAVRTLGDFFDSVQIFCSRHEAGTHDGTRSFEKGSGNWFAREGQVQSWIRLQDEFERMRLRRETNL